MEPADGGPSDEPEVHRWSAVHEKDVGMEEDTGERMEEREGCEWMIPGAMEMGVEKGELEVLGICEEETDYVREEQEKETGMGANSQLEEEEVTGTERGSSPKRKKLKVERMEEKPQNDGV
jgi:hypothetical protein